MSDMIERVARATFECRPYGDEHSDRGIPSWETLSEDWREAHRNMARAAIEAMREPSEEQIELLTLFIRRCVWGRENVIKQYRELIDAALSQDTHSLPTAPVAATNPPNEYDQASAGQPAGITPSVPAGTNSTGDA